ncbi:hypothetical protein LIER_30191 [Lithospermum erythrorhizon]|uniref:Uncharacterized protein n=1 Tax=Lithospermum erythrorhizon TaxID=34254 RepID=A0AAV3RQ25_LITER
MAKNQGTISYHGLEELKNHRALIKATVFNTSKDSTLYIDNVDGYVVANGQRLDQKISITDQLGPRVTKDIKLYVLLPTHARGVSNAKIGIIIPNVGHITVNSST